MNLKPVAALADFAMVAVIKPDPTLDNENINIRMNPNA